jgi:hypothetical protein
MICEANALEESRGKVERALNISSIINVVGNRRVEVFPGVRRRFHNSWESLAPGSKPHTAQNVRSERPG